jgi:hypothetical protein
VARVDLDLKEMLILGAILEDRAEAVGPAPEDEALEFILTLSLIRVKLLKACKQDLDAEALLRRALEE